MPMPDERWTQICLGMHIEPMPQGTAAQVVLCVDQTSFTHVASTLVVGVAHS